MNFALSHPTRKVFGSIRLDGSKSISNRALIIRALSPDDFSLQGLSTAKDTQTLQQLLQSDSEVLDVGPAGTTFRFLTAYLALQPGRQVLTGSARMLKRPIGALVNALNSLGANISFLEQEGYPPLAIETPGTWSQAGLVTMPATISSQFISALLMVAPKLPGGLTIALEGTLVSPSYLKMTLSLMEFFGAKADFVGNRIRVYEGEYTPKDFVVEADWSAASYHYALAAFAADVDLRLHGLQARSWQGDAISTEIFDNFGVESTWQGDSLRLLKSGTRKKTFTQNFIDCPDIAQTVAVVAAGLGIPSVLTGLETLYIKETDRVLALKQELAKVGVPFFKLPAKLAGSVEETFMIEGAASWSEPPSFETYHDHRMAMAFAPLALINPIVVKDIEVVDKSYPAFWKDLVQLGYVVELVQD